MVTLGRFPIVRDFPQVVRDVLTTSAACAANDPEPLRSASHAKGPPDRGGLRLNAPTLVPPSTWVLRHCRQDALYKERQQLAVEAAVSGAPLGALQAAYPREYNSFRGAKQRAKYRRQPMGAALKDFRNWLAHVGVHPDPDSPVQAWSVDCITRDRGYTVGNLRWADRQTQNENRSVSRWVSLPDGGKVKVKKFAQMLGQPYDTVYKALKGGRWRRKKTPEQLLTQFGQTVGMASWRFPDTSLERAFIADQFKGRKTTRIQWYMTLLEENIHRLEAKAHRGRDGDPRELDVVRHELASIEAEAVQLAAADEARKCAFVVDLVRRYDDHAPEETGSGRRN